MEKNDVVQGVCESLGTNGEGIVKVEGVTLFVPYLLVGERASIKILKIKGNVGYGKIEEIFTPAEERVRPACSAFFRCGGCQLQHIVYREQLKFKTRLVKDTLKKVGGIDVPVSACEKSNQPYGYRNKLQLPIGKVNGQNAVGFYAERSHRIIPITECPIHPDWARELIAAVYKFMETCGQDGYDEQTGEGLRHIVVREIGNKHIVTLVSTTSDIKGIDYFLHLLDGIFKEYSFYLNVNAERTNVVFGKQFLLLKGAGVYEATDCGITYEAGASTFLQVNAGVREKLYQAALSLAVQMGDEAVIDCYSGGGLMTAMFAARCRHAYGIEVVPEATRCANSLKEKNGLQEKMTNLNGRVEDLLGGLFKKEPNAVVVLDPPRAGIDRSVLKALLKEDISRLVLISCNPATLARDLGILTGTLVENERGELVRAEALNGKYEIFSVQPYDMFPQTKHVETLVLLSGKK